MTEFGERLRQARQKKGVTQQTVAEHVFVTRQAVSQWESGARYPDLLTAKRLAAFLDVPLDLLLSDDPLEQYPERNQVLEPTWAAGLQTAVYTLLSVLYLLVTLFSLGQMQLYALLYTTCMLAMTILSVYATRQSILQRLSPRVAGALAAGYFALQLILKGCAALTAPHPAMFVCACLLYACGAVAAWRFFTERTRSTVLLTAVCAAVACGSAVGMLGRSAQLGSDQIAPTAIAYGCLLCTMAVTVAQAQVLQRKRRRAAQA